VGSRDKKVVPLYSDNPRWKDDFEISKMIFAEAGVDVLLVRDYKLGFQKV
jgi:hypothetical protein